jgi:hypothetical protein
MALEKNVTVVKQNFAGELVAKNAYWKITKLAGSKHLMNVEIDAFVNNEKIDGYISSFVPNLEGKNFIAQAYDHLKTLPNFANATDC